MKLRANSRPGLLLVQPLQAQWQDAAGLELAQPPAPDVPVRIVADLIEETHVRIEVPGLMGADRSSFIQVQLQALLPDVPLRATWQRAGQQPLLPKPFVLNAVGVASQALNTLLTEQAQQQRPLEGVWPLSYLMARWARRQKQLPANGWLFLCLSLGYGLRMVLLHNGVPVFSRLLLDTSPEQQAQEMGSTLKYLVDTRVLDRMDTPGILLMQPPPGLEEAVQAQGRKLLPTAAAHGAHSVLADVLALADTRAPGQMASIEQRRYYVAGKTRKTLQWTALVLALAITAGLVQQAQGLLAHVAQAQQWQQQATEKERDAQALREKLSASGTNVALLRLAMQVQQSQLQGGVALTDPLWLLGQLMQVHPQADLQRTEMALLPKACQASQGAQPTVSPEPDAAASDNAALRTEWSFEIQPLQGISPLERQTLLDGLAASVQAWPGWKVQTNPVRAESGAAIVGGTSGATEQLARWRWCLVPSAEAQEPQADGAEGAGT